MKIHIKIFLFTILDTRIKDSKYEKTYFVHSLYLIFNTVDAYFEKIN